MPASQPLSLDLRRLLLLAIFGVMLTHYWLTVSAERDKLDENQQLGGELSRRVVADKLDHVVSSADGSGASLPPLRQQLASSLMRAQPYQSRNNPDK